ncbi:unnamed protein product [Sympodiomycopsis kandeliae]
MPKFDPKQQQKKLRRHNPIAKTSDGSAASGSTQNALQKYRQKQQQQPKLADDAIPLLSHLPISPSNNTQAAPSSLEDDEQRHRALLGLNPLLLSKSSRVALLAPQHQLLQRLLFHLDHPRLEVRKEAAGCLRNLCVEGKWSGREQIWKLGGGATALAQIEYAARQLGLLPPAPGSASAAEQEAAASISTAANSNKKPEEMNRKERRHAAKAANKAASARSSIDGAQQVLPAAVSASPASAAAEADAHDLHLLHLSLLENHLTILWCLLESISSPVWLITLNRSSLGDLLIAAITQGAKAFEPESQALGGSKASADRKEQREIKAAQVEVAFTAANLLAAWLEDNPAGCAAIAGLPLDLTEQVIAFEQAGSSALPGTKSRKRLDAILDKFGGAMSDSQVQAARKRIDGLTSAVNLLSNTTISSAADLERINLALLSLASCCNLLSPLPSIIRSCVPAPSGVNGSVQTLTQWQVNTATPLLMALLQSGSQQKELWKTADKDAAAAAASEAAGQAQPKVEVQEEGSMDVDQHGGGAAEETEEDLSKGSIAVRTAEALTLAVDLLGEICTEAESEEPSVSSSMLKSDEEQVQEDGGEDMSQDEDDTIDEDGDDADSLTSEQEEEMLMLAEADHDTQAEAGDAQPDADGDMSMSNGGNDKNSKKASSAMKRKVGFGANPYAILTSDLGVATCLLNSLNTASNVVVEASSPSGDFTLAIHNTLAALLSGLASHAHPPPTHPLEEGSRQERKVHQFISWVTTHSSLLGDIWQGLNPFAAQLALQARVLPVSVPIWTSLLALTVCYEGVSDPSPHEFLPGELKAFSGTSLDYFLSHTSSNEETTRDLAIETTCLILSQLSYLSRIPQLAPGSVNQLERISFTTSTYLTLLLTIQSIPLKITLVSINSLIDLFSDEESSWDASIFRRGENLSISYQGQILAPSSVLNILQNPRYNILSTLKEKIKHVDPRRSESQRVLKEEAEEVLDNFKGWLSFRESVQAMS